MTSPRPWRVVYHEYISGEREVWNIVDANGEAVVETDAGFYPPKAEDAEMLVDAVNGTPHCEHCQAVVADLKREMVNLVKIIEDGEERFANELVKPAKMLLKRH